MKKYNEYMDGVTVSDTLHEKLKHLEAPKKKPQTWKKYGAMAAALVLVLGLGAWGVSRMSGPELGQTAEGPVSSSNAIEIAPEPVPSGGPLTEPVPGDPVDPNARPTTIGGYEVHSDAFGGIVSFHMLPYIEYGQVEEDTAASLALPLGVYRRELTAEEVNAILNGENIIGTHLDWSQYDLGGYALLHEDGTLFMLVIHGSKGNSGMEHFVLEVAPGHIPATCMVYEESVVNEINGAEVTADGHDGKLASTRRVSFLYDEFGYRFEVTGADKEDVERKVSRLVRFILGGVNEFVENGDKDYRVTDIRLNFSAVPAVGMPDTGSGTVIVPPETLYDENGNAYTQGYDPSASQPPVPEP